MCFLFGTLAPLGESSLGCIACELLNHDQSLPIQISSEALPIEKDNFLITVQDLVFYFTSVGTDLVVSILIAVTWFILAALCFREQCLHLK